MEVFNRFRYLSTSNCTLENDWCFLSHVILFFNDLSSKLSGKNVECHGSECHFSSDKTLF